MAEAKAFEYIITFEPVGLQNNRGELCLKSKSTQKLVRCKDCRHRDPEDRKCDSGQLERAGCVFPVDDNYFCAYGEE